MIHFLEIPKSTRVRLWLNEAPDASYRPDSSETFLFASGTKPSEQKCKTAAIELLVGVGPMFMYGLIGGKIQSNDGETLLCSLSVSNNSKRYFKTEFKTPSGEIFVGLPSEYANSLLDIRCDLDNFRSGNIIIDTAAYSTVGSSPFIFRILFREIISVLNQLLSDAVDEDEIAIGLKNRIANSLTGK